MKKYYPYIIIAIISLSSSCSSLLDVEAENTISGNVLTDAETIQKALTGCYYTFNGISDGTEGGELMGGDFIIIPELLARVSPNGAQEYAWQTILAPNSYRNFVNKEVIESNDRVATNWRKAFEVFNLLNNILANVDVITDTNERNRIQGEALAMRGILLFEMVVLWAPQYDATGVDPASDDAFPFTTEPITDINEIPKLSSADIKTIDQIYDQAEADLSQASGLLESFGTNGTSLSYFACQAYLAKLSLQKGEFGDAEDYADEVISSGEYSLASNSLLAFNNNSNSSEDIYAIQQTLANNVGDRSSGYGLTAYFSSLTESGIGVYRLFSPTFFNPNSWHNSPNFEAADLRGSIDLSVDENTTSSQITTAYYKSVVDNFDEAVSTSKYTSSEHVLPIIRLAEMYLIRAEANYTNLGDVLTPQALADLNAIRTRAGIAELTLADFPDQAAFFDSLVVERTREFMHEGMLLEDLKRWGGFIGSAVTSASEYDPWDEEFVLPIPRSERDTWTD
ncbi:RagB/SusD family nutrient uptake outer membrane protein [Marinoscillum sp.]|uniref:RagB/SusD family nutrient uptake outer membrane protein n=1 Tax=Marinoscillum sp. TaxID=2024838 RepID=UPI003BAA3A65